jgi:hypothetical protein
MWDVINEKKDRKHKKTEDNFNINYRSPLSATCETSFSFSILPLYSKFEKKRLKEKTRIERDCSNQRAILLSIICFLRRHNSFPISDALLFLLSSSRRLSSMCDNSWSTELNVLVLINKSESISFSELHLLQTFKLYLYELTSSLKSVLPSSA